LLSGRDPSTFSSAISANFVYIDKINNFAAADSSSQINRIGSKRFGRFIRIADNFSWTTHVRINFNSCELAKLSLSRRTVDQEFKTQDKSHRSLIAWSKQQGVNRYQKSSKSVMDLSIQIQRQDIAKSGAQVSKSQKSKLTSLGYIT
jgi:hypothetical protein